MDVLEEFIIRAKAATYVGGGNHVAPTRTNSHDLVFSEGSLKYLDSYYGGKDFVGQEAVWENDTPLWAMNYYGRILDGDLIDAGRAANVIKAALSTLYAQGRFLGEFNFAVDGYTYEDRNMGGYKQFVGVEKIFVQDKQVYQLDYHGGIIIP